MCKLKLIKNCTQAFIQTPYATQQPNWPPGSPDSSWHTASIKAEQALCKECRAGNQAKPVRGSALLQKLLRRKKILWVAKSGNFQWSRVWTAGDNRERRMALQTIPTIYQQGEYNKRQTGERWKMYVLATDLKYHPRSSAAGTMNDPCSHRTAKR